MKLKWNTKKIAAQCKARTDEIEIGKVYFLSSFYDKDGAFVKVLSKSHKLNNAGWPSSVEYEVVSRYGDSYPHHEKFYAVGARGSCNASNLYEKREMASHEYRFGKK